jgi:hypothetical protein
MPDDAEPVELVVLPNEFIAEVLVGMLRDEGIAAFVQGEQLQDEFAFSQRLLGNLGTRVFVHPSRVEEARKVLAAARAAGRLADEEGGAEDAAEPSGAS